MTPALGVRAWGDITMTDTEMWRERRAQLTRYRVLEQETTEPLAALLLHDIVLELQADMKESQRDALRAMPDSWTTGTDCDECRGGSG
jgi:hypothetical protein